MMIDKFEKFFYKHMYVLAGLYFVAYMAWFEYLEHHITNNYHIIHTALDDFIPFNPYFIVPYTIWAVYISATLFYFAFIDKKEFFRYAMFLAIGMSLSLLVCTIFPNGTDFRPTIDPNTNWAYAAVAHLYSIDTCTNVFPSIHVVNSIGTHIAICRSKTLGSKAYMHVISMTTMILICLSTLFLKQHSVIDVAGGCIMAYFLFTFIYSKVPVPAIVRGKQKEKALA